MIDGGIIYPDPEPYGTEQNPYTSGNPKDYTDDSLDGYNKEYGNGLYDTPELAAYAFGAYYNGLSIKEDVEYGAIIVSVEIDGKTVYTWRHAYKGTGEIDLFGTTYKSIANMLVGAYALRSLGWLNGEQLVVGTVHTHGAISQDANGNIYDSGLFFSPPDVGWLPEKTYLITADGSLHYLDPNSSSSYSNSTVQTYLEREGFSYGTIIGYGLPNDPNCGAYTP